MTDIKQLAVATDTRLAEIYDRNFVIMARMEMLGDSIQRNANAPFEQVGRFGQKRFTETVQQTIANVENPTDGLQNAINEFNALAIEKQELTIEAFALNAVWVENGRWTRAFLVVNNNGHVHKDMMCSTCFDTTRFTWLTQYSASTEVEIVEDAGEDACTVCYPSAPAEVLNRPSVIVTADKIEKAKAKAERDAKKAEREAKRIATAPTIDGSPLTVRSSWASYREVLKTERSARIWYTNTRERLEVQSNVEPEEREERMLDCEKVLVALAEKHGVDVEAIREELEKKVQKKVKDWYK